MKISCQACHSKYNVADDKVHGKVVKIRCRKCGATIVVNGSGAVANGTAAAASGPSLGVPESSGGGGEWHVSVSDSDQRTMTLADVVSAYNAGTIHRDTFVWSDGMDDWKPLGQVDAIASALPSASSPGSAPAPLSANGNPLSTGGGHGDGIPESAPASPPHEDALVAQAAPAPAAAEPRRAAVKREPRSRDLFATRTGEELRTGGADGLGTVEDGRLTGQRNENSVLFSLEHLTKNAEERAQDEAATRRTEDSGMIDLKALAAKAESLRPAGAADVGVLGAPLGYSAAIAPPLGTAAPLGAGDAKPKSKLPLILGAGAGVAVLLVLGIGIGLKLAGSAAPVATTEPAASAIAPTPSAEASASAAASAAPAPSAAPSATAVAATAPKPRPMAAGGGWHPSSAGGGKAAPASAGAAAGAAGGGAAAPPPPKKNDCGCNGDLMCMMKCSTH